MFTVLGIINVMSNGHTGVLWLSALFLLKSNYKFIKNNMEYEIILSKKVELINTYTFKPKIFSSTKNYYVHTFKFPI